jgi:hypothetical protein
MFIHILQDVVLNVCVVSVRCSKRIMMVKRQELRRTHLILSNASYYVLDERRYTKMELNISLQRRPYVSFEVILDKVSDIKIRYSFTSEII